MNKKKVNSIIILLAIIPCLLDAQVKLPQYPDSLFSTYYHQRLTHFNSLPLAKGDIVFLGNSITDGGEWSELFNDLRVKNRGISGDNSAGVLHRLSSILVTKPAKIFLMIGVNDLAKGVQPDSVLKNIFLIADYIRQENPATRLFIQSILPVNAAFGKFTGHASKTKEIAAVNTSLEKNASAHQYTFIDLFRRFTDQSGKMSVIYTNDGLHLVGKGYLLWKHLVFPFVNDLALLPSLLPLPVSLKWTADLFPLSLTRKIYIQDKGLHSEAEYLQRKLGEKGLFTVINDTDEEYSIELRISKQKSMVNEEGYQVHVSNDKILVEANTPHGIFNGIQTIIQLARDGVYMDGCTITDWPAFSWRGYMIDVGRNFMSVAGLKQQIDAMALYKLNVFHFHATEDIAWRLAISRYPQLTAPENMLRDKGLYYSKEEIRELIRYCRDRHINFIPEIDMPGHSGAFKRAMHTDMQSDSGLLIVTDILKEICDSFDLSYVHIGADEVKITNPGFIPAISRFLQERGKKIIGWQPGGNFINNTIRQLWMDDAGKITGDGHLQYIDSRHLYLNHMDPLEAVTTIYNRRIGSRTGGDSFALGGTICVWHDRAVADERDIMRMNPVYPSMLAFSERSWRGGGQTPWISNVSDGEVNEFSAFENRLMDQQQLFFTGKPFPYIRQSGMKWKLYGPYENKGILNTVFDPESKDMNSTQPYKEVSGGTIVLRHWWAPLIKGAINEPEENTTWYAVTGIWSDEVVERNFWIGFNNLSRSPATDAPPVNAWDSKGSGVWVNGIPIPPPFWKRGGQKGNAEVPLSDEGYEYRDPVKIVMKKGWNTILLRCPVGTFRGKDWQNPVKWMFTCIPVDWK